MKLLYIILFTLILVTLSACTNEVQFEPVKIEKIETQKPDPVKVVDVYWRNIEGNMCLSSTDGVKYNTQTKDVLRYIRDLQSRLCYMGDDKYCIDNPAKTK